MTTPDALMERIHQEGREARDGALGKPLVLSKRVISEEVLAAWNAERAVWERVVRTLAEGIQEIAVMAEAAPIRGDAFAIGQIQDCAARLLRKGEERDDG